jgi:hypothetical protein
MRLDRGAPGKITTAWCADNGGEGAPVITTSDGTNDGLVWTAGAEGSGRLHAWDLVSGRPIFAGGTASDAMVGLRRYATPVAVHGRLIVAGDGRLYAFRP